MVKRFLIILLLMAMPVRAFAAIEFVASAEGTLGWNGALDDFVSTGAWSLGAGKLVVVCVRWGTTLALHVDLSSVTDTAGNTYADVGAGETTIPSSSGFLQMFYTYNTTANASNVVTATFSGDVRNRAVAVVEYSGVLTTDPVDTGNEGTSANSLTVESAAFTPSVANTVALACVGRNGSSSDIVAGDNYTERVEVDSSASSVSVAAILERNGAPVESQTASAEDAETNDWWGIIVYGFKAAVAASRQPIAPRFQ